MARFGDTDRKVNRPTNLGNVLLRVENYLTDQSGEVVAVKGKRLNAGPGEDPNLTVGLASAAKYAAVTKRDVGLVATNFEGRRPLDSFADSNAENHVKPGGVLSLSDVRLYFEDKKFYATRAMGVVQRPDIEDVLHGYLEARKFNSQVRDDAGAPVLRNGQPVTSENVRMAIFQPQNSVVVSPDNADAVFRAFDPHFLGMQNTQAARVNLVTIQFEDARRTFIARSASLPHEDSRRVDVADLNETLKRTKLGTEAALAMAAVAAAVGLQFGEIDFHADVSLENREVVEAVYKEVAQRETNVTLTPGMSLPVFEKTQRSLLEDGRFIDRGLVKGSVGIRFKMASNGEAMDRPAVKFVGADNFLSQQPKADEQRIGIGQVGEIGFKRHFEGAAPQAERTLESDEAALEEAIFTDSSIDF